MKARAWSSTVLSILPCILALPLGQGHETTTMQICADGLGVPIERISVLHGSTDLMPYGVGTFGSRGTVMAGNAVHLACQKLREKMLALAGRYLQRDAADWNFAMRRSTQRESNLLRLSSTSIPWSPWHRQPVPTMTVSRAWRLWRISIPTSLRTVMARTWRTSL